MAALNSSEGLSNHVEPGLTRSEGDRSVPSRGSTLTPFGVVGRPSSERALANDGSRDLLMTDFTRNQETADRTSSGAQQPRPISSRPPLLVMSPAPAGLPGNLKAAHNCLPAQPSLESARGRVAGPRSNDGLSAVDDLDEKASGTPIGSAGSDLAAALEEQGPSSHVYPEGGYGWVVLVACATLAGYAIGWGMCYSVFQDYYVYRHFPHEDPSVIGLIGATSGGLSALVAFVSGRLGDRFGFKRVLYAAAFLFWAGLFTGSFCTEVWQLILTQGVLAGTGRGMAMPVTMALPSQRFHRRRGLASGIAAGGAGLGGGINVIVSRKLIVSYGYQRTLLIFSFIALGAMTLSTTLMRTGPESPEAQGARSRPWIDKRVLKTSKLWSLAFSLIMFATAYGFPWAFLTSWMTQNLPQVDPVLAAVPPTLLAFTVCFGRMLVGFVADLIGPVNAFILCFLLSGCTQWALWLTAKSFAAACGFAIVFGLVAPGYLGLIPAITVELFGPANLATNVGFVMLLLVPGNSLPTPLGDALFSATGSSSFSLMIWVGGAMQIGAALIACWMRMKLSTKVMINV